MSSYLTYLQLDSSSIAVPLLVKIHIVHIGALTPLASTDASFSTSFSPNPSIFAVASQDGVVSVFDHRKLSNSTTSSTTNTNTNTPLSKLATLRSSRMYPNGALRKVSFSDSPLDLLLFTEASSAMHIVDARTFQRSEITRHTDRTSEPKEEIGGACWGPGGRQVFVGFNRSIVSWDVDIVGRKGRFPSYQPR